MPLAVVLALAATVFGSVKHLGKEEFETLLRSGQSIPALMYAPWCGHCKSFKPKFRAAGEELDGLQDIYMIDCTDEGNGASEICKQYDVKGFPTIKMFNPREGSEPSEFQGARDVASFKAWVLQTMKRPFKEIRGADAAVTTFSDAKSEAGRTTVMILTKSRVIPQLVYQLAVRYREQASFVVMMSVSDATTQQLAREDIGAHMNESGFSMIVVKGGRATGYTGEAESLPIQTFLSDAI